MEIVNDFDRYAAERQKVIRTGRKRSHHYVIFPALSGLLPDLTGKTVLMLGCGSGDESRILASSGAHALFGIDISAESIHLARKTYPAYTFSVEDMHSLSFPDNSYDFVYSSLTIHYSSHPIDVYKEVYRVLKKGGVLQFVVIHPVLWATERVNLQGVSTKVFGYSEDEEYPRFYGNYMEFAEYTDTVSRGEVLRFWVGPPSLHFKLLKQVGFTIENFVETQAIEECKQADTYYYERFSRFPQFMIFVARKVS